VLADPLDVLVLRCHVHILGVGRRSLDHRRSTMISSVTPEY
jgi:hypothetical protein